jgi:mRNA-degrading endonuclease RelE of RelBE toxin-antitoxin system
MRFRIRIEPEAYRDIQEGIDWYNEQQPGLGRKFHFEVKVFIGKLKINPFFQVRYNDVRCLPLKQYPYMIHFTVDEERRVVTIWAVFKTSRTPTIWKSRK